MTEEKAPLSAKTAALHLGVSARQVRYLLETGALDGYRVGKLWKTDAVSIETFKKKNGNTTSGARVVTRTTPRGWRDVFGIGNSPSDITRSELLKEVELAFREMARRAHPDAGGSNEQMAELAAARDAARKELA